jgi:hypothetical protein
VLESINKNRGESYYLLHLHIIIATDAIAFYQKLKCFLPHSPQTVDYYATGSPDDPKVNILIVMAPIVTAVGSVLEDWNEASVH